MEIIGVSAPRPQLVARRIQSVRHQPGYLIGRVLRQLPQPAAINLYLIQAERPFRSRPVAEHDAASVERQIASIENPTRKLRTQLRHAAGVQIQDTEVPPGRPRLHELGIVPAGAVCRAFDEQDLTRRQQRVFHHQRSSFETFQRLHRAGQRGRVREPWFACRVLHLPPHRVGGGPERRAWVGAGVCGLQERNPLPQALQLLEQFSNLAAPRACGKQLLVRRRQLNSHAELGQLEVVMHRAALVAVIDPEFDIARRDRREGDVVRRAVRELWHRMPRYPAAASRACRVARPRLVRSQLQARKTGQLDFLWTVYPSAVARHQPHPHHLHRVAQIKHDPPGNRPGSARRDGLRIRGGSGGTVIQEAAERGGIVVDGPRSAIERIIVRLVRIGRAERRARGCRNSAGGQPGGVRRNLNAGLPDTAGEARGSPRREQNDAMRSGPVIGSWQARPQDMGRWQHGVALPFPLLIAPGRARPRSPGWSPPG